MMADDVEKSAWDDILAPAEAPVSDPVVAPPSAITPFENTKKKSKRAKEAAAKVQRTAPAPVLLPTSREDVLETVEPYPDVKLHGVRRVGNRFAAVVDRDGKHKHLGTFDTAEEAHKAYLDAGGTDFNGNRQFTPTEAQRKLVRDLAIWGMPAEKICNHVINPATGGAISADTLRRHFNEEVGEGLNIGDRNVLRALHDQLFGRAAEFWKNAEGQLILDSTGKPIVLRQELKANPSVAIFLSKARPGVGLRETTVIEHGKTMESEVYDRLKALPRDKLEELRAVLRSAAAAEPDGNAESPRQITQRR